MGECPKCLGEEEKRPCEYCGMGVKDRAPCAVGGVEFDADAAEALVVQREAERDIARLELGEMRVRNQALQAKLDLEIAKRVKAEVECSDARESERSLLAQVRAKLTPPAFSERDVEADGVEDGACCVCGRLASACANAIVDPMAYPDDGEWFCSRECDDAYHAAEGDYERARAILRQAVRPTSEQEHGDEHEDAATVDAAHAEHRAQQAEREVERLTRERDAAEVQIADAARWKVQAGIEKARVAEAEAEVERLREGLHVLVDVMRPSDRLPRGIVDTDRSGPSPRLSLEAIVRNMLAGREWDDDGEVT